MFTPSYLNLFVSFNPVGITPAVCLTQDLPPGEKADILLIECGDARNVLFTAYSNLGSRSLDITCCDMEPATLARNILLYTLLLDDENESGASKIWNIYYHTLIDNESLELLQSQADKLLKLATSNESWENGQYGKVLRFCDRGTLGKLKDIWATYTTSHLDEAEKEAYKTRFKAYVQKTMDLQKYYLGQSKNTAGVRSAAPVSDKALKDLPALYQHFWKLGRTKGGFDDLFTAVHPNPMLANLASPSSILHYSTDPLLGFYLATAYIPLAPGSPLQGELHHSFSQLNKVVQTARTQFELWSAAFKKCASKELLTMRFFAGDELSFCHLLKRKATTNEDVSIQNYRLPLSMEPFALDGEDYSTGGTAPLTFNVIETSGFGDYSGGLNVMLAAVPLLRYTALATLYTESIAKTKTSHKVLVENFLCGHLPTMSLLLGIIPVEYYTNASAISTTDERMMVAQGMESQTQAGLMHTRLAWKRTMAMSEGLSDTLTSQRINIEKTDLTKLLHGVYQEMFNCKGLMYMTNSDSFLKYTRKSFAAFLHLVKSRVNVDWENCIGPLTYCIYQDSSVALSSNYMQELFLYLHYFGVWTNPFALGEISAPKYKCKNMGFLAWPKIPTTICITMVIPREKLKVLTKLSIEESGAPNGICTLRPQGTEMENVFAVVHLAFGTITTSGARDSEDFKVLVKEDKLAWAGKSPLIASFYTTTCLTLEARQKSDVKFQIEVTPETTDTFVPLLGQDMIIHQTTLDSDDVYFTKYLPNHSAYPTLSDNGDAEAVREKSIDNKKSEKSITDAMRSVVTAKVDQVKGQITQLRCVVHFPLEKKNAGTVEASVTPAFTTFRSLTSGAQFKLFLPIPESTPWTILGGHTASILAPLTDGVRSPYFMHPILLTGAGPVVWNMPYLNLACLPIVDVTKHEELGWVKVHLCLQFSGQELVIKENKNRLDEDVRISLKENLFAMFMQFSGVQAQSRNTNVFALNDPKQGGVQALIFVSAMRLDMANHTIILDAAVLPFTKKLLENREINALVKKHKNMANIKVNHVVLKLWKTVLPALVERCRTWSHMETCEYQTHGNIPLSLSKGDALLCSCGKGQFPSDFITNVPLWTQLSRYAVRAAISPSFTVPLVEQMILEILTVKLLTVCGGCGTLAGDGSGKCFLRCDKSDNCVVGYCDEECQTKHWKVHKKICGDGY